MRAWLRALRPQGPSTGPGEIRALTGVRALAALSVVFYHTAGLGAYRKTLFGWNLTIPWYYTQTGVHLFFVLSGFVLFLPYARAMLEARPLPPARRFYGRRALRILPAYWVCMLILVLLHWPLFASPVGLADVGVHTLLLHDDFYRFNRAIEGPFWTLALEAQFYLLLPLLAAGVARLVGATRSPMRLVGGVLLVPAGALLLRKLDAIGQTNLWRLHGAAAQTLTVALRATMGMQGKFVEVFAVGMLCSVLYVVVDEQRRLRPEALRWLGLVLLAATAAIFVALAPIAAQQHIEVPPFDIAAQPGNALAFFGPLLIGLGYGTLVLAVLWSGGVLRAACEWRPLVFVGAMSYSLYLWHLPIVHGELPVTGGMPLIWRVISALAVAYVSYWLLERPWLRRRAGSSLSTTGSQRGSLTAAASASPQAEPTIGRKPSSAAGAPISSGV